jgi:hypothetical protein
MPIAIKQARGKERATTTTTGGQFDGSMLEQLLDTGKINKLPVNYNLVDPARIEKRTGRRELLEVAGGNPILIDKKVTDTLRIFAYGTTLAWWNLNTNTAHSIKTDFTNGITDGVRIGKKFYTCNGVDGEKIYETTLPTLAYDTQTVNFQVGEVITGGTSGKKATIIADNDGGATGTLTLDNITGEFTNGEDITGDKGGAAKANGTITYTNTAVISASSGTVPKCKYLFYFDLSLVAGNTNTNDYEVHVAKKNDVTDWDFSTTASGDSYKVSFERAGEVTGFGSFDNQGIENLGNQLFIGYSDGYFINFLNPSVEIGGVLSQNAEQIAQRLDRGVLSIESTAQGVYYTSKQGVFFRSVGQQKNQEDINLTRNFGEELNDFSFEGSKILFIPKEDLLLISCRREGSSTNNSVLVHDTRTTFSKNPSWWRYQGWRLNTIELDGDKVYGGSSIETKLFELFTGTNDNGNPIQTEYEQYLNIGDLQSIKEMYEVYVAGKFTLGYPQTVSFEIVDETGQRVTPPNNSVNIDSTSVAPPELAGLGTAGLGYTGLGGTTFRDTSSFTRAWYPLKIYNFTSLILRLTGSDAFPHQFNWITVKTAPIRVQRKGLMTLNT